MPRSYPPEAVRDAAGLYMAGLDSEAVAEGMRRKGYAQSFSAETVRRWAAEYGWEEKRAGLLAQEANLLAALDADRLNGEMLVSLIKLRGDLEQKRTTGEVDFAEGVNLLLKVDAQIRQLMTHRQQGEKVDKPALALEVLRMVLEHLAEADPIALEGLTPHVEDLGELIKERWAEAA